jgi:hypothetical protein
MLTKQNPHQRETIIVFNHKTLIMKHLLKLFFICTFCFFSFFGQAQTFGIRAGLNLMNQVDKNDYLNYNKEHNYKMLPGGHIGFVVDVPVLKPISIETGLFITTKGHKRKEIIEEDKIIQNDFLFYVELPVYIKYPFELKGQKLFALAGPYFAYGIWGKQYSKFTFGGETLKDDETLNFGSDIVTDNFVPFDMGIQAGTGINLGSIVVQVLYSMGLKNISTYTDSGNVVKNNVLSLSVGMNFGKNNKKLFSEFTDL